MRRTHKHESNEAGKRGGLARSSDEGSVMELKRRGRTGTEPIQQQARKTVSEQRKQHAISRVEVERAWRKVRAKGGKGGVDGASIKSYESNLANNLYKLWNRMASGSYHPKAVLRVEIPKGDGKTRPLGIPTIEDRIAQEVVRARLEPVMEKLFHRDSYGFRPDKSATEAVGVCRARCWKYDWVLDVDIQRFFDTINHELMLKAVRHHSGERWVELYISRWLKSPIQHSDGTQELPTEGTPQGGVISPLLANLYLHYAFDHWMTQRFPGVKFERYADDIVIHCATEEETREVETALKERLKECGLTLHPEKTKVVYCKDSNRKGWYPTKKFTFLGYTFQPRRASNSSTGQKFTNFLPAVSKEAGKKFRTRLKVLGILRMRHLSIGELAHELNLRLRGWYEYFRHYYPSALSSMTQWLDNCLVRWLRRKYVLSWAAAIARLNRLARSGPRTFVHWMFRFPGRAV